MIYHKCMKKVFIILLYIALSSVIYLYTSSLNYLHIGLVLILIITAIPFALKLCLNIIHKENPLPRKKKVFLYLISISISLFLIYSFNIYKHNPQVPFELEISAANTKSIYSKGYNVPLYSIKPDDKVIDIDKADKTGVIKSKNLENYTFYTLVSDTKKTAKIKIHGLANKLYIIFNGSEDSGNALVKINNKTYIINTTQPNHEGTKPYLLYSSKPYSFSLNNTLSLKENIFKALYIISYFFIFLYSIYFLGLIVLNSNIQIKETDKPVSKSSIILYSLPILTVGFIYLLIFFPGIMSFDCLMQWTQAHTNTYYTDHPLFHTYLIHLLSRIYDNPCVVAVSQIFLLGLSTGYFLYKLEKYSIPKILLVITSSIIAITPFTDIMIISLWKDVFFNIGLYILIFCILFICIQNNKFFESKLNIFLFISSLILTCLTRYNGITTILFYIIFLIIFLKETRINIIKSSLAFIIISLIITSALLWKLPVQDLNYIHNQKFEVFIHQIQTAVQYNRNITISQKNKLLKIAPEYMWETVYYKYKPEGAVINTPDLFCNKKTLKEFMPLYIDILKSNFYIMFKDIIILNSYLLKYKSTPEGYNYTQEICTQIANNDLFTTFHQCGINRTQTSFFPSIKNKIEKMTVNEILFDLLYKPTPYFIIFLIFGSFFVLKNGYKAFLILLPILLTIFFIAISMPFMSSRYLFILFILYPLIILLSFVKFNTVK